MMFRRLMALVVLLGVAAMDATALPNKGGPYSDARRELARAGWKPVISNERLSDGSLLKSLGAPRRMVEAGFVETVECTGTGLNYCQFLWSRGRTCLRIITQGEYRAEYRSPRVYAFHVERCPARAKH